MSFSQKELVLFAGGTVTVREYIKPKALLNIDCDRTILETFLEHLPKNSFSKIHLLIEVDRLDEFEYIANWGMKNLNLKIQLTLTETGSSTEEKLVKFLSSGTDNRLVISYPDVFSSAQFWSSNDEIPEDKILVTVVPITSRFPRVLFSPFESLVKGVSAYQAKVPANPHHVFSGRFEGDALCIKENLNEYRKTEGHVNNLEVGFFDWLAARKSLISKIYLGPWFVADGPRDYHSICEFIRR